MLIFGLFMSIAFELIVILDPGLITEIVLNTNISHQKLRRKGRTQTVILMSALSIIYLVTLLSVMISHEHDAVRAGALVLLLMAGVMSYSPHSKKVRKVRYSHWFQRVDAGICVIMLTVMTLIVMEILKV